MSDEEYEKWVSERTAAVRANIEAMTPEKAKAYLQTVAGYIVSETARAEDFDWPPTLHLADVLEKHLARGLWNRINELENALSDMAALFDIENRRVHNIEGKAWAVVPAADAQRAYDEAVRVLKADGANQ